MTEARQNNDEGKSYFAKLFQSCSNMMQSIVNFQKQSMNWLSINYSENYFERRRKY